ncbi:MAG: hypothetical protein MPW14_26045 (plasmid) [Candidatus Manganitrophus sp.]|nr:MAG: hypothetical protein MPW14_26045 [Candidatus Manganitrophus sp.]
MIALGPDAIAEPRCADPVGPQQDGEARHDRCEPIGGRGRGAEQGELNLARPIRVRAQCDSDDGCLRGREESSREIRSTSVFTSVVGAASINARPSSPSGSSARARSTLRQASPEAERRRESRSIIGRATARKGSSSQMLHSRSTRSERIGGGRQADSGFSSSPRAIR